MSQNIVSTQVATLAKNLNMANVDLTQVQNTLTQSVFKCNTQEEFVTLLIVANQYKLNPFTKEIYAFAKGGKITPIVSVDGWARIINDNPLTDGIQFEQDNESCTCKIYRKDRTHPTVVTEYLDECQGTSEPWRKYPKRMLRHKALIQCARVAFGFSGIYDEDEAKRIDGTHQQMQDITPTNPAYKLFFDEHYSLFEQSAQKGVAVLQSSYQYLLESDNNRDFIKKFWEENSQYFKQIAQQADLNQSNIVEADYEPITT